MSFRVIGLSPEPFFHLYGLNADELKAFGAQRSIVDAKPGFPDRVEIRDLEVGETVLLLNFMHQPADTPFRPSHAIFVREGVRTACEATGVVPMALFTRALSMRAFDAEHMMVDADLATGPAVRSLIHRLFQDPKVSYIHAHAAKRGCYLARIERC